MANWQLFGDNVRDIDKPVVFGVRAELILSLRRLQKLSSLHPGTYLGGYSSYTSLQTLSIFILHSGQHLKASIKFRSQFKTGMSSFNKGKVT